MLTKAELAEIAERCEKATRGKWKFVPIKDSLDYFIVGDNGNEAVANGVFMLNDAAFIASCREDVPKLLAEIERLNKRLSKAVELIELDTEIIGKWFEEVKRYRRELTFISNVDLTKNAHDKEHIAVTVKSWALDVLEGVNHDG